MIVLMAGTSDARELAALLKQAGFRVLATVVTENAAREFESLALPVQVGRLQAGALSELLAGQKARLLIDATHPFAEEASQTAMQACQNSGVEYLRYERMPLPLSLEQGLHTVADSDEAARLVQKLAAGRQQTTVLLTTGSKTLPFFAGALAHWPGLRLMVRLLPRSENLLLCEKLGIEQKNILAMQGPFSAEFNRQLYRQYGVNILVTKESGQQGSTAEKIESARLSNIETVVIGRPKLNYTRLLYTFDQVLEFVRTFYKENAHEF